MSFTPDTTLPNDFVAPFEKAAFFGAMANMARGAIPYLRNRMGNMGAAAVRTGIPAMGKAVGQALPQARPLIDAAKMMGAKYGPTAVGQAFEPMGKRLERGVVNAAGRAFGNSAKPMTHRLVRGIPREMVREGVGGAAIGGLVQGGMDAATAEDGQGLSSFAKGFGSGAASGAGFGMLTGGVGKGISNARSEAARRVALHQGVAPKNLNSTLKGQSERGFFGSIKDLATRNNKGPLGLAGAGLGAAGGAAQFGGEWLLPGVIMPGEKDPPPPPPPPQPFQPPQQLQQQQQPQPKLGAVSLRPIDFMKLPRYHNKRI